MNIDIHALKPFGDTLGDGSMQISFTLPIEKSDKSAEAAKTLASKMGLDEVYVAHEEQIAPQFTFFVVYGRCLHSVDLDKITPSSASVEAMEFNEINDFIKKEIGRALRVVGACIETDAHTVGIDAILNMKGCAGDYGLERYSKFEVKNMGAQVKCEALIAEAVNYDADAILVSTIVTQKDIHIHHLTKLIDMLEAEKLRNRFLLIVGGPRISHGLAKELGYDAGFGRGTLPSQVATYLAQEMKSRLAGK
ncbi:MAG: OAM dimerization domain-containing protein [Candidatus Eremiobacteraeota bacterium]|nr:OAM dimerization domain-containing protein [Candidatus Eremiobacteraeota bacterium]